MSKHIYKKPNHQIIKVYRGQELKTMVLGALEKTFPDLKIKLADGEFDRFSAHLCSSSPGGRPVLIIEQWPLDSVTAHGKYQDLIYAYIRKTGNQYTKKYRIPYNPRTPGQQSNRFKHAQAVSEWHNLTESDKNNYRILAKNLSMTGFNLFISRYLKSH